MSFKLILASKKNSYHLALSDLECWGYTASLITIIEIGALGHWLPLTRSVMHELFSKSDLDHPPAGPNNCHNCFPPDLQC